MEVRGTGCGEGGFQACAVLVWTFDLFLITNESKHISISTWKFLCIYICCRCMFDYVYLTLFITVLCICIVYNLHYM